MPGRLYLIDPEGKVASKSGRGPFGFKPAELEQSLVMLLRQVEGQETRRPESTEVVKRCQVTCRDRHQRRIAPIASDHAFQVLASGVAGRLRGGRDRRYPGPSPYQPGPDRRGRGAGFEALYAVLAWLGWVFAQRFRGKSRPGRPLLLASMAGLFLFWPCGRWPALFGRRRPSARSRGAPWPAAGGRRVADRERPDSTRSSSNHRSPCSSAVRRPRDPEAGIE